jgi:hypothetical protein
MRGKSSWHRAVDDLTRLLAATRRIPEQTRQRLSGTTPDGHVAHRQRGPDQHPQTAVRVGPDAPG